MTLRPPRFPPPGIADPTAVLDYEVAQEKASAPGRQGRALEAALSALDVFDRQHAAGDGGDAQATAARNALLRSAGFALWCFVVQREACGLRDSRQVFRDYRVPADVIAHMGIIR